MTRTLIVLTCCSLSAAAQAQFPDLLDLSAQYLPTTDLESGGGAPGGVQVPRTT